MAMISVVICTYNRADLLANALRSVCEQSLGSDEYEVIVVDNNSTDHTREVVERFVGAYPNVRYCLETQVGLSHARNRGWQEAKGEYVAYTDDDCEVPPEWLAVAKEIVGERSPVVFGGPYQAFYMSQKPPWYKDSYGSMDYGPAARCLSSGEALAGNNMFFRRQALVDSGGFDAKLGMTGGQVGYGEDNEIQNRLGVRHGNCAIYYDPRLTLGHLVRAEQMTIRWVLRAHVAKGRYRYWTSQARISNASRNRAVTVVKAATVMLVFARDCLRGLFFRDRERYPYYQNWLYERAAWRLAGLGKLQAQLQSLNDR